MEKLAKAACVETLRPKTVPQGLIVLGTIAHVTDHILKLQISGGITCVIDRGNVTQVYCDLLQAYNEKVSSNSATKNLKPPPKLTTLFKRGQQYVCKILDSNQRKSNPNAQHVSATLEPSAIFEDVIPATFFAIPNAPIQCVVRSVEDHGYQMDMGFKNLTGFLNFKDTESKSKLMVGQVVRCCLRDSNMQIHESRSIHLTMTGESLSSSDFTPERVSNMHLNENCILPGTRSFCTVLAVKNEGLLVNLMNEFGGFVHSDNLKSEWDIPKENYHIADKFECTILYRNHITNAFALSLRPSKRQEESLRSIIKNYHVGQTLDNAKVAFVAGTRGIYFKLDDSMKAIGLAKDFLDTDPGTMTKDEIINALDFNYPAGSKQTCRVKSFNLADTIIYVGSKAMIKEAKIRQIETELMDPERVPQSIHDFERLVLKSPNCAEVWTKYSRYFLDNVETEKARIVCRRALKTINFRQEKEKLKVWLHLIKIEAKYGGKERLQATIAEAARLNDPHLVYSRTAKLLTNCNELDEAERVYQLLLKTNQKSVDMMIEYIEFLMQHRKDSERARTLYEKSCKDITKNNLLNLQSRFARLEFKCGDVERGKTIFENILNDNPKKTDIWRVYQDMIRKFGTRLVDNEEVREQNDETLKRISESIDTIRNKPNKKVKFQ